MVKISIWHKISFIFTSRLIFCSIISLYHIPVMFPFLSSFLDSFKADSSIVFQKICAKSCHSANSHYVNSFFNFTKKGGGGATSP